MFVWIGIALLSASWLYGLEYYHSANGWAWGALVLLGTACLAATSWRGPRWRDSAVALGLSLPALLLAPWPYKLAMVLVVLGLLVRSIPQVQRFAGRLGGAMLAAGCVLLTQCVTLIGYEAFTARSHELPAMLAPVVAGVGRLLNMDVSSFDTTLPLFSMRKIHMLGATWELLLDPATCCFLAGAVLWIVWRNATERTEGRRWLFALRDVVVLSVLVALWLPLRAALLMALYLHNVLLVDYEVPLNTMPLFWSGLVHLLLLAGPVLLAWRFVPRPRPAAAGEQSVDPAVPAAAWWRRLVAAGLVGVGCVLLVFGIYWDPAGERLGGRVVIEEYHPNPEKIWERCDKPFDTTWYGHMSGYNYYCIVDYLSRFYDVSRRTTPLDDEALANCDVLMLKVPTRPYSPSEIESVRRFVEGGGGLLLIGEHTNVFGSGTYLNQVARHFGLSFRYDCLFGVDSVFDQRLERPLVPHPILQHMPPMEFATSCSLAPGGSRGRSVILSTGLKNLSADYHVNNFYPQPYNSAEMRYGAFVQLWSMRSGQGRVVAFTDSTIFSNFCTFEPGKAELMLGMIEWLNHRTRLPDPRPWLVAVGLLALAAAIGASWRWNFAGVLLLGAGLFGWSAGVVGVWLAHAAAMPAPQPVRPMVRVATDQTVSRAHLPKNGFIDGKEDGFGIFERWILRLGYFTSRLSGPELFALDGEAGTPHNDLVVIAYPGRTISPESRQKLDGFRQELSETGQRAGNEPLAPDERKKRIAEFRSELEGSERALAQYRDQLVAYVEAGGKVLVVDSPENDGSTANELLDPFGLSLGPALQSGGVLESSRGWAAIPVKAALQVQGGDAFATVDGKTVAASIAHGKGLVVVVGFGSRLSDAQMGATGDVEPDDDLKKVFSVEYSLLRWIVEGKTANPADGK